MKRLFHLDDYPVIFIEITEDPRIYPRSFYDHRDFFRMDFHASLFG